MEIVFQKFQSSWTPTTWRLNVSSRCNTSNNPFYQRNNINFNTSRNTIRLGRSPISQKQTINQATKMIDGFINLKPTIINIYFMDKIVFYFVSPLYIIFWLAPAIPFNIKKMVPFRKLRDLKRLNVVFYCLLSCSSFHSWGYLMFPKDLPEQSVAQHDHRTNRQGSRIWTRRRNRRYQLKVQTVQIALAIFEAGPSDTHAYVPQGHS